MQIKIPLGSVIDRKEDDLIRIKVPNTKFWVLGEKRARNLWNMYLTDPKIGYKDLVKENITSKEFAMFSSVILKTPFPGNGKRAKSAKIIKRFINQNIKIYE